MTRVGWIGLGKLGLPCALAMEALGGGEVRVVGHDGDPGIEAAIAARRAPWAHEHGVDKLLETTALELAQDIDEVVERTDGMIFVAVQTPHEPEYGGDRPAPMEPADFHYGALGIVANAISEAADARRKRIIMVVISTALPGTMRRVIVPLLHERVRLVYNPYFIAMGSAIEDFTDPEFVLVGGDDVAARVEVAAFYRQLYGAHGAVGSGLPVLGMRLDEAELTKVAYNTFISLKIVFANALLELCESRDLDVDTVTTALSRASRRLLSPAYLRGGVGDGGGCHPRDNIAMSWLAQETGLSADPFAFVTRAREAQSQWLVDLAVEDSLRTGLPIVVIGKAYKPESTLTAGSPALLLCHQLDADGFAPAAVWDPLLDEDPGPFTHPAVFVVMTAHERLVGCPWPPGSIVIDPHRYLPRTSGVRFRRLGEGRAR